MKDHPETKQIIIGLLVNKQPYFKELVSPFIQAKEALYKMQGRTFEQEIEEQFKDNVFKTIADDISYNVGVSTDEIYEVLENLNLENYLKAK